MRESEIRKETAGRESEAREMPGLAAFGRCTAAADELARSLAEKGVLSSGQKEKFYIMF